MRYFWLLGLSLVLAGLAAFNAYATESRVITASAGAPIPTAYSSSNAQSMVWNNGLPHKHMIIQNTTSSAIACMDGNDDTNAPDQTVSSISEEIPVPATTTYNMRDFIPARRFYCRSASGSSITSGTISIVAW